MIKATRTSRTRQATVHKQKSRRYRPTSQSQLSNVIHAHVRERDALVFCKEEAKPKNVSASWTCTSSRSVLWASANMLLKSVPCQELWRRCMLQRAIKKRESSEDCPGRPRRQSQPFVARRRSDCQVRKRQRGAREVAYIVPDPA